MIKLEIKKTIYFLLFFLVVVLIISDRTNLPKETIFDKLEIASESGWVAEKNLSDFKTDGCTLWPDSLLDYSWQNFCIKHDFLYWINQGSETRLKADQKLRDDINNILPGMGDIVYLGTRLGGGFFVNQP